MVIFIDIDGTLTDAPTKAGGRPVERRVARVRELARTCEVVLWSARGSHYAFEFASANRIRGVKCVGKPDVVVDDNPSVRPGGLNVCLPEEFFA